IADSRRSGLTHVEFRCRRQISVHAFRHWLYRRLPDPQTDPSVSGRPPAVPDPAPSSTPPFLPVHIRPASLPRRHHPPGRPLAPHAPTCASPRPPPPDPPRRPPRLPPSLT